MQGTDHPSTEVTTSVKAEAKVLTDAAAVAAQALLVVYEKGYVLLSPGEQDAIGIVRAACDRIAGDDRPAMHCTEFVPGGDPVDSCARRSEREDGHADVVADAAALEVELVEAAEQIAAQMERTF